PSFDIFSFDPVTRIMYFTDRVNRGVDAINTQTNTYLGTIPVPSCQNPATAGTSCPSGVMVVPDLRKMVVTDRLTNIFIYDLTGGILPGNPIATLSAPSGTDEMDYDPLNRRAYVANTNPPFFIQVVDLVNNVILGQIGPWRRAPSKPAGTRPMGWSTR